MEFKPIELDIQKWANDIKLSNLENEVNLKFHMMLSHYIKDLDVKFDGRTDGHGTGVLNELPFSYIMETKLDIDFNISKYRLKCAGQCIHYLINMYMGECGILPHKMVIIIASNINYFVLDVSKISPILFDLFIHTTNPRVTYDHPQSGFAYDFTRDIVENQIIYNYNSTDHNMFLKEIYNIIEPYHTQDCIDDDDTYSIHNIWNINKYRNIASYLQLFKNYHGGKNIDVIYSKREIKIYCEDYNVLHVLNYGMRSISGIDDLKYFNEVFDHYQEIFPPDLINILLFS